MKFTTAVDEYMADMRRVGRHRSPNTEDSYRRKLYAFADLVGNRDPSKVGRDDVKRFLGRWEHPNSQNQAHAVLTSFFDYAQEEGWTKHNPARHVRRARRTQPTVYRMTREEAARFLAASNDKRRDRWVAHLLCCTGVRNAELRALQGRHFARPGWIWVEHGKGSKQRWVPVTTELEPVVDEILTLVGIDEYVIPGRRIVDPPFNTKMVEDPHKMLSASALHRQVMAIGERAGIAGRITPHVLRHCFGDHVAKYAGLRVAQWLMGHEDVSTTAGTYTSRPSLDEIAAHCRGLSFGGPVIERDAIMKRDSEDLTA